MIINDGFYLRGFSRIDKGEAGAVFLHYEEEQADRRKPEIEAAHLYYGGTDSESYTLILPKPRARKLAACAIVTRSSKNCYSATVYDERRIDTFKADSLDGLRKRVAKFFGV